MFILSFTGTCICPDMNTGGMLWFTNLCEHDPYHVLSVITGLSFLFAIEVSLLFFNYFSHCNKIWPI
jgi:hypothetical protein